MPHRDRRPGPWHRRLAVAVLLLTGPGATPALASADTSQGTDPEATREVVGLLLNFLGITVVVVILLLVLGLPARSWLRQRRRPPD